MYAMLASRMDNVVQPYIYPSTMLPHACMHVDQYVVPSCVEL